MFISFNFFEQKQKRKKKTVDRKTKKSPQFFSKV